MESARDVYGAVFERGSAVFLARIVDNAGSTVDPAAVSSITYTVLELDEKLTGAAVPGHDQSTLDIGQVLFASPQVDAAWTVDATGYNFRHEIDVSQNEAFPKPGVSFQVRYELTPTNGQKIVFRFLVRAI